jgi:hypothetical protein
MSNFIYTIECYLLIQSIKSSFIIFKKYKGVQFRTTFIYIYIYIYFDIFELLISISIMMDI